MTLRHHIMKDRPSKINVSEWVDDGKSVGEYRARLDIEEALRDTGECEDHDFRRDIEDDLICTITWKPRIPTGNRLMRVDTNLED